MPAMSWVRRVLFSERAAFECAATAPPPVWGAEEIREEMLEAVHACSEAHRRRAESKLRLAASPLDLWQLRPEIYLYLAQDLGQCEANEKINALVPMFRGWVPQAQDSGFPSR